MFRGLTTITYSAEDVEAAARWYAEVLGVEPYFRKEFAGALAYVEFRLGDYSHELGILDRRYAGARPPRHRAESSRIGPSTTSRVHTSDWSGTAPRRTSPVTEQGPGFVTASVYDPFGNVVGVMFNQHYLDVVAGRDGADS